MGPISKRRPRKNLRKNLAAARVLGGGLARAARAQPGRDLPSGLRLRAEAAVPPVLARPVDQAPSRAVRTEGRARRAPEGDSGSARGVRDTAGSELRFSACSAACRKALVGALKHRCRCADVHVTCDFAFYTGCPYRGIMAASFRLSSPASECAARSVVARRRKPRGR